VAKNSLAAKDTSIKSRGSACGHDALTKPGKPYKAKRMREGGWMPSFIQELERRNPGWLKLISTSTKFGLAETGGLGGPIIFLPLLSL
jgi:hypothetical protein